MARAGSQGNTKVLKTSVSSKSGQTGENRAQRAACKLTDVILLDIWVTCLSKSDNGITKGPMSLPPFIVTATYTYCVYTL